MEAYAKTQGLWLDPKFEPDFSERLELDLGSVEPSIAGPKRPQDRVALRQSKEAFRTALRNHVSDEESPLRRSC